MKNIGISGGNTEVNQINGGQIFVGVDLSLNYPTGFEEIKRINFNKGIIEPGPQNYAGPNFLSEPEIINMYEFKKLKKFDLIISLQKYNLNYDDIEEMILNSLD